MSIFQLLLYRDLPPDFRYTYGNFISGRKRLNNGWQAVWLSNGFTFMLHKAHECISVPSVKKIQEVFDGKFILKTTHNGNIVFARDGKQLTPFDKHSLLYPNGWYQCMENGALALFDAAGKRVAGNLRFAKVYPNGMYFMSVNQNGDATCAGVFDATGRRLWFSNSTKVKVLHNGWFVADNTLVDNNGSIYIDELPKRKVPNWLLCLIGSCMRPQKK